MIVRRVKIGGVIYGNVGDIKAERVSEYYYNVRTLDGVLHQKLRYRLKNYTVQFFNLLTPVYDDLKDFIKFNKDEVIECGFPTDNGSINSDTDFVMANYKLTVIDEIDKGYFKGKYFRNGLTVYFEAVTPDE